MKLFISYGHKDYPSFLNRLYLDLRREHEVWVDSMLRWGDNWKEEIDGAIDRCDLFLFIKSMRSVRADSYCYHEIDYAREEGRKKPIRVISVDDAPMPTVVEDSQWFDMDPAVSILEEINEEEYAVRIELLLQALRRLENGETEPEKEEIPPAPAPNHLLDALRKACDREIGMKYGAAGIDESYLSELALKQEIPGLSRTYQTLSGLVSDLGGMFAGRAHNQDVRLLLSGDVYTGRSTQLLEFWRESLEKAERIVFYLSPHALSHMDPFIYIYETWLRQIPTLQGKDPREAFRIFKSKLGAGRKAAILIDDYDRIQAKEESDHFFKYEDLLIDQVDVIVKIRYRDASWPQNYHEAAAVGVRENKVLEELRKKKIEPADIEPVLSSLRSPWLLKLLIDDQENHPDLTVNPGRLIRKSIRNRVEAAARGGSVQMDVLRFSVYGLLPRLEAIRDFNAARLRRILPETVEKVAESGDLPEGFEALDYLEEIRKSRNAVFQAFFRKPIVDTMGLMRLPDDPAAVDYVWKDPTVGNYYYAESVLQLLNTEDFDETLRLIEELIAPMLVLDDPLTEGRIDPSGFVCFDRTRYLFDLAEDEDLRQMEARWPKQLASLYGGVALVHELVGNSREEEDVALKALAVLNRMHGNGSEDPAFMACWLNKMAYFVIKSKKRSKQNVHDSSLTAAKEALETARGILEGRLGSLDAHEILELSKVYGNIGAYYLNIAQYETAIEWHQKSLKTKQSLLERCGDLKEAEEGIRRSLVCLATDCFYLKRYEASMEYHDQAIEIGERIQTRARYESCSRKAGSWIRYLNEQNGWTLESAEEILELLVEGLVIMGDVVNRKEAEMIYHHAKEIFSALAAAGVDLPGLRGSELRTKASIIENQYNMATWKKENSLRAFFEAKVSP